MTHARVGLRLRLLATLLGAALLCAGLLAVATLLPVRDALYARRVSDARERLRGAVASCAPRDAACFAGAGATLSPDCAGRGRHGDRLVLCEPLPTGAAQLTLDLLPVREQLAGLDARLLFGIAAGLFLLLAVSFLLLERGFVRRLDVIDTALARVDAEGDEPLLPAGADAVGRLGGAVNRLGQRLREERLRLRAQIAALEESNRALREAREDLARSERLASVGRLAAGVAHEVGNPVSAIIAYAALLRQRIAEKKDPGDFAERIESEAGRVDRILRDLLELARPGPVQVARIDLRRAVERAASVVSAQPGFSSCAVEVGVAEGTQVLGDEHYVAQVFINLFSNAQRAGAAHVRVEARAEPDGVRVEVSDDGPGIAAAHLPRLFEPFFTTGAPGQGTGLGLALCHATLQRLGGSISARPPAAGGGAIFEIFFPPAGAPQLHR